MLIQSYQQFPLLYQWLFAGGLAFALLSTPLIMLLARRVGAVDSGGYRKVYKGEMPLLGGLALAIPLCLMALISSAGGLWVVHNWRWVAENLPARFSVLMSIASMRTDLLILGVGALGIVFIGIIDDIRGIRAPVKLLGQLIVAAFVCATGYQIRVVSLPLFGVIEFGTLAAYGISIFWIVGLINAFNLIDGLDGLASGLGLIATATLFYLGLLGGDALMPLVCALVAGSLLGFLFYNFHPARIFLGDTGSMLLGYTLGTLTLLGQNRSETAFIVFAPFLALSLPIFETLISMIRRFWRGMPIFSGDSHHTHHRLLRKGYSQRRVVLTLYACAIPLALAGILSALIERGSAWSWVSPAIVLFDLFFITWLAGYLRPESFQRTIRRRQRNALLNAMAKYVALELSAREPRLPREEMLLLCRRELGLGYLAVGLEDAADVGWSSGEAAGDLSVERMRVDSATGEGLSVRFRFEQPQEEQDQRDTLAALASVFQQTTPREDMMGKNDTP